MTSGRTLLFALLIAAGTGCDEDSSGSVANGDSPPSEEDLADNVVPITVNGALCLPNAYPNQPCVSVTICSPGNTSQCQRIDGILLDTGSVGLRIFRSLLTEVSLPSVPVGSGSLAECVHFGSGESSWGPVQMASVILGKESAIEIPIHVIDSTFGKVPVACGTPDRDPSQTAFNGILGIGRLAQDCGTRCAGVADNQIYYACDGAGACSPTRVPVSDQVPNPVALLPRDNNGAIVRLPSVPSSGAPSAGGQFVLGIGTRNNNRPPSGVAVFSAVISGEFNTTLGSRISKAFIDTGSNALFFDPPSAIETCSSSASWFCPSSPIGLSAITTGATGAPSSTITWRIASYEALTDSSNMVFGEIGGPAQSPAFDWGLPFFLGRDVYLGFEGKSSSLGTGTYIAF